MIIPRRLKITEEAPMDRAKELFLSYHGNRFYMDHDGVGAEYEAYRVSKETEKLWAAEFLSGFLTSETQGKEALQAYSCAADLVKTDRREDLEKCLYYPLRSPYPDDVTCLFMLRDSFRLAERAAKKHQLPKADAEAYLRELDRFISEVSARAERGTLTRSTDYVMQEFSDPVYVAEYLSGIRKKWSELLP